MRKPFYSGMLKRLILSHAWLLLSPLPAIALPTPDILVGFANILPLITGAAFTLAGGGYYLLKKRVVPRTGEFVAGSIFGVTLLLIFVLGFAGYSWNQSRQTERIRNLTAYLRCDFSAHESFANSKAGRRINKLKWRRHGNFRAIAMEKVADNLRKEPNAALIATYRTSIAYASGIPAIDLEGELLPFEYLRKMELPAHLAELKAKDLYLVGFSPYGRPPEEYPQLMPIFKKFEHVYIVSGASSKHRYVYQQDGSLRPIDTEARLIDWPVRREKWVKDERRVQFPEMTRLVADTEVVKLLADERIRLVAPYDSSLRMEHTYLDVYLKRLLLGIDPDRVLTIDLNSAKASQNLEKLAGELDGEPFLVIGITKYDWVYSGLDFAFDMWEKFEHNPDRFRLVGFTTRLPEVVALSWMTQKEEGLIERLKGPFWNCLGWLKQQMHISTGAAILIFAVLLRILFFPIGMLEAGSRMVRMQVKLAVGTKSRPLWSGSNPELLRHLGAHGGWELLGTLVTLALIMPAYRLLTSAPETVLNEGFFWIEKLGEPDILFSILAGALIFAKLMLGKRPDKLRLYLPLSAAFSLLLCFLPSSLIIYLTGVLLVTTTQDLIALRRSRRSLSRALLGGL